MSAAKKAKADKTVEKAAMPAPKEYTDMMKEAFDTLSALIAKAESRGFILNVGISFGNLNTISVRPDFRKRGGKRIVKCPVLSAEAEKPEGEELDIEVS